MLSNEQVLKFQNLYKKRFGIELSKESAYEQATKLLRLIEIIYKPMTEKDYLKLQNRRKESDKIKV